MATAFYLKLTDIPGECKDKGFEDQIKLHSWSFGMSNPANIGGSSGASGGKVQISDFTFVKEGDKATTKMLKAMSTGTSIPSAVITGVKSTGAAQPEEFIIFTLTECYVTNYTMGDATEGSAVPMENSSIAFAKIKTDYKSQGTDGKLVTAGEHSYDRTTSVTA